MAIKQLIYHPNFNGNHQIYHPNFNGKHHIYHHNFNRVLRNMFSFSNFMAKIRNMNYIPRKIDAELLKWKVSSPHKPLLIRGARQIGKSSSVRNLGATFESFVEVNFDKRPELKSIFSHNLSPQRIIAELSAVFTINIRPGETLLFIDEIQECEGAITALRYFREELPELHVIAAGSLLEFTLKDIASFGVGRIRSMFMYPMTFDEFLHASNPILARAVADASVARPLGRVLHEAAVEQYKSYMLVGGMPEAVNAWVENGDYLQCREIHEDIVRTYEIDFAKYGRRVNPTLIRQTLHSVVRQLGSKFIYSRVGEGFRSEVVKEALELLTLACLITPVYATSANGLPLEAELKQGFVKYLYLDPGLLLAMQNMQANNIGEMSAEILTSTARDLVNKGPMTEMIAGNELIRDNGPFSSPQLYYWVKEDRTSNAEVDYLIVKNGTILPIEVKAGVKGGMKSLRVFMEAKKLNVAVRLSLEPFGAIAEGNSQISIIPLYSIRSVQH